MILNLCKTPHVHIINYEALNIKHSGVPRISRRGAVNLVGVGADSRGIYVSKFLYVEKKESGTLGERAPMKHLVCFKS